MKYLSFLLLLLVALIGWSAIASGERPGPPPVTPDRPPRSMGPPPTGSPLPSRPAPSARPSASARPSDSARPTPSGKPSQRPPEEEIKPYEQEMTSELAEEIKRYKEEIEPILAELRELARKIREEIEEELEDSDDDPEAVARKVRDAYYKEIMALLEKLIDADIKHTENVLKIKKDTKDEVLEKAAANFANGKAPKDEDDKGKKDDDKD